MIYEIDQNPRLTSLVMALSRDSSEQLLDMRTVTSLLCKGCFDYKPGVTIIVKLDGAILINPMSNWSHPFVQGLLGRIEMPV